ncbi:MAG: hypothetical protein ABI718_00220 [Acidobacteriota bacterium]
MPDAFREDEVSVPSLPLRILFAGWLLGITGFGFVNAWLQLSHLSPRILGYDYRFALYWVIAAAIAAIFLAPGKTRPYVFTILAALLVSSSAAMIVLSGELAGVASGLAALLAAGGLGSAGFGRLPSSAAGHSVRFAAGMALLGMTSIFLARFHLLRAALLWPLILLFAAYGATTLLRSFNPATFLRCWPCQYESCLLLIMGGLFALANFTWVISPELKFDALNYHLPVAQAYAASGGIVELSNNVHAYNAGLAESVFAIALSISGQTAVKILVFFVSVLAACAIGLIASRVAGTKAGVRGAVLFLTVPLIGWESSTTDVELFLCLFLCGAVLALLDFAGSGIGITAFAILAGAALGTKILALMAMPVLLCWLVWILWRHDESAVSRLLSLAATLALVAAFAVPWYAVRYHFTGDPVFPYYANIFPTRTPVLEWENHVVDAFRLRPTPLNILKIPWLATFQSARFSESGLLNGGMGLMLLVLFPWGLRLVSDKRAQRRWLLALAASTYIIWSLVFCYARFYVPVLPWVTIGGVLVLACYAGGRNLSVLISSVVILIVLLQGIVMPAVYWEIFERFPFSRAFGQETRESLIGRSQRAWGAGQYINEHTDPDEPVVSRGLDRVRFYVHANIRTWQWDAPLHEQINASSDRSIAESLRRLGVRYVVLDEWTPAQSEPYSRPSFLASYTTKVYDNEHLTIYLLRRDEPSRARPD